jgi:hypothetical protein
MAGSLFNRSSAADIAGHTARMAAIEAFKRQSDWMARRLALRYGFDNGVEC